MPVNIIAHDTRLEGRTPVSISGTITFEVGGETSLGDFFERVVRISGDLGGVRTLFIMARGVFVASDDATAIEFCREFISYRTVHLFEQLREKVGRIVLFVSHAAENSMTSGDDDEMCRRMAIAAQAEVVAAREVQTDAATERGALFFCEESALDFGEWKGAIVVCDGNGNIVAHFTNPGARRDREEILHEPRIEPHPRSGEPATFRTAEDAGKNPLRPLY